MKLRNVSDRHLDFTVDGERFTAVPGGFVTPDVRREKVPGVLKHHHLPIKIARSDEPDDEALFGPPPPGPALMNTSERHLDFHIDGVRHRAVPGGHLVPDIHPSKIPGALKSGLPLRVVDVPDAAREAFTHAAQPPAAPAAPVVVNTPPASADDEDPGDPPDDDTSKDWDESEELAALTEPDGLGDPAPEGEPGVSIDVGPVNDAGARGRGRGRRAAR